jgi:Polyphosphate kinase 2 (PPK2)
MAKDKRKKHETAEEKAASGKMKRKEFEKELGKLQVELVRLQTWVRAKHARVIVVFEGRDTAGKGGVISRIAARTSPRVYRHVALPTPSDRENQRSERPCDTRAKTRAAPSFLPCRRRYARTFPSWEQVPTSTPTLDPFGINSPMRGTKPDSRGALPRCSRSLIGLRSSVSDNTRSALPRTGLTLRNSMPARRPLVIFAGCCSSSACLLSVGLHGLTERGKKQIPDFIPVKINPL